MDKIDWNDLFLNFNGRITRQPFWIGFGILVGANIVIQALLGGGLISIVLSFVLFYPLLSVSVKRCHDRGKSGWWCLIYIIPIVGLVWAIIDLGILEGDMEENQYGPAPVLDVG